MKRFTFSILLVSIAISSFPQSSIPFDFLDIGNVRALVHADGQLFQDLANNTASYEVPKGSGNHAIYASAFWMTAQKIKNNYPHISAGFQNYGNDLWIKTGPVDIVNQIADTSSQFQRLWKIDKFTIDNHIANWNSSGYVIPNSILDWPGNGNSNTAKVLAPFVDLDNDSIYEPATGEYPLIKGDQAIYTISNTYFDFMGMADSVGSFVSDGNGGTVYKNFASFSPLKIETHMMVYGYISNNLDILNSVFVTVKMYNRSNSSDDDHFDFKLSLFTDFDAGNPSDDFIGTDTTKNMVYAYNGDNLDDGFAGSPGYGTNLPAVGVKFLDYELDHSIYFNPGSGATGSPGPIPNYINYQRSKWLNDQNVSFSGNGFDQCVDTLQPVNYVYSGDPTLLGDTTQWTEEHACVSGNSSSYNSFPGDRRISGGPNLPSNLNHGANLEFNYAYIFAQSSVSNVDAVGALRVVADTVQNFFDRNTLVGLNTTISQNIPFAIYPNPTTSNSVQLELNETEFKIEVHNIQGKLIKESFNQNQINVSDLSSGMYFITVLSENRKGVKKLVVSK